MRSSLSLIWEPGQAKIDLRLRAQPVGQCLACEEFRGGVRREPAEVEAEVRGQAVIQNCHLRSPHRGWGGGDEEYVRQLCVSVVEPPPNGGGAATSLLA